ncbi:MAG: 3-isopropylmalate dehydratase small subunit [bacterium]|nr:3-isopropylmalate dehydratase small subunit [bacterium]
MNFTGKVHKYGDNVNTDVIIPTRHCTTIDPAELAKHCLEDLDPDFVEKVKPGDILMAGNNFGCGSSREVAPIAIKASGISCVIAASFARIFYRNAVNIGFPIVECPGLVKGSSTGDLLEVRYAEGVIVNRTTGERFSFQEGSSTIREIIAGGGLVNYVREKLGKERRKKT